MGREGARRGRGEKGGKREKRLHTHAHVGGEGARRGSGEKDKEGGGRRGDGRERLIDYRSLRRATLTHLDGRHH